MIRRPSFGPLFWILLFAAALRLTGLGFGLHHPDEHLIINHALAFGTGDLNPHMFYLPTFFMYLLFALFGIFYAAGHVTGMFSNPDDFLALFLRRPEIFYLLARVLSAFFGVATVGAIYALGRLFKNRAVGTWAALFLAVNFLHVRDSHFATMDIALTFFVTYSLYELFRFSGGAEPSAYWRSVVAAAAATATKYNGILLAVPIAMSYCWVARPGWRLLAGCFLGSAALFIGVFFCLSPFVLLDLGTTREYLRKLYELNRAFQVPWHRHLEMLWHSLGPALALMALMGFIRQFMKPELKKIILVVFAALYYVMITKAGQPFERYVLVLIPISLLWAADAAEMLAANVRGRLVLGALVLLVALPKTLHQETLFFKANTRDLAREWIAHNIAPGERLALDDPGEAPRLVPSPDQVREQIARLDPGDPRSAAKKKRLETLLGLSPYPKENYDLYFLTDDPRRPQFTMLTRSIPYDRSTLERLGVRYLVVSEASLRLAHPEFYEELMPYLEEVFRADPRRDPSKGSLLTTWTTTPIDSEIWTLERPGPLLRVFKINFS